MIGTPITGTLFYIEWQHVNVSPDKTPSPEGVPAAAFIRGDCWSVSADPSGADLYEVARGAILNGKATPAHEFAIVHTKRACELKGRAIVAGGSN